MDFDFLARPYRFLEGVVFGPALQRARTARIDRYLDARSVLLLGDGDGRFLGALLDAGYSGEVISVDSSAKMIELAKGRIGGRADRVTFVRSAVQQFEPPAGFRPDLVSAHFFFDCFTEGELAGVVDRVMRWMPPRGQLVVTEFAVPESGWLRRFGARVLIRIMLVFFRLFAGVPARRLPDITGVLAGGGLRKFDGTSICGGLITSEIWGLGRHERS